MWPFSQSQKLFLATVIFLFSGIAVADVERPYSGQETRAIKALSSAEISGLQSGDGLGYAKAAELNGYPGPRHVLDNAADLGLSDQQRISAQSLFDEMNAQAVALGTEIIALETDLDNVFADRAAQDIEVARLTNQIGNLEARLRASHLLAHIRMRSVLQAEQIVRYNNLRGYEAHTGGHKGH